MIDARRGRIRVAIARALVAAGLLLPTVAAAQPERSVPTGSPLGALPIQVPRGQETPAPLATGEPAQPDPAEALSRARRLAAYRARQAALLAESARPLTERAADPGRRPDQAAAPGDEPARPSGGVPSIFGGGIGTAFGGGVRPAWQGY